MKRRDRRAFLRQIGKAGAGLAGAGLVSAAKNPLPLDPRAHRALSLRRKAGETESLRVAAGALTNGDEALYPSLIANFTKGFLHNSLGEGDAVAYQALLHALSTQEHADFEKIPIGYGRKLVNPESAFTYDLDGGDSHCFSMPPPPAFASAQAAAEMVELYWQSLARDVPFTQWDSSPIVQSAAAELNSLSGYRGPLGASNVFRGTAAGCLTGPYLSQYLLKTMYFGSTPREQMYRTGVVGYDYMTTYGEWLELQSGLPPYRQEVFDPVFRYIRSGRDLAQFVHYDFTFQAFLQAALVMLDSHPETLLNFNTYQLSPTNPYKTSRIQTGFVTFNQPHVLDLMGRVTNIALKPACYHKWAVHRRLRPEEFGGRVHNALTGAARYPIHSDLMNSQAVKANVQATGNALLPQAYVEGCPIHPSYPAGHAVIAGACATVLKAFFDENALLSGVVKPSEDGLSLVPEDGLGLTIGGELNKLAFNIPMGRNWAGIHYRTDASAGLALGEAVAISVLQDHVNCCTETFSGFQFTAFDGTPVTIATESVGMAQS